MVIRDACPQHSVVLDHKIMIEGVSFHELKKIETYVYCDVSIPGDAFTYLTHSRAIGDDRKYMVKQKINVSGYVTEEPTENEMTLEELNNFKNEWEQKWRPPIAEESNGIISTFFEDLEKFFR